MKKINSLMVPMWPLYNISNIDDMNFDSNLSEYLKRGYDLSKRKRVFSVLEWAQNNSEYSFKKVMENSPNPREIKFSNKDIFSHLMNFKKFMENEEFCLLTDDRPTAYPWERD
ncbi:hypothetical protein [uncultured Tenacibaculum sp.]|uniref:hypothetical protein n=1 Tax=uncultured Tenacibaculum sp. TaxID=174713 RepID=UPI00260B3796|nr:hypothetical protein [uncultured Tenacibaculum sp.]